MRSSVPAAVAALMLGLFTTVLCAEPARAAAVFLELNPSTARPGDEVSLRAGCTDNLTAATVTADPFGRVTVQPRYGFLTASARVPAATRPGDYRVSLRCPDGKTASATLHIVARVEPARGPATGGGGTAPGRSAPMLIGGGVATIGAGLLLALVAVRRRRHA